MVRGNTVNGIWLIAIPWGFFFRRDRLRVGPQSETLTDIARSYNVSHSTISRLRVPHRAGTGALRAMYRQNTMIDVRPVLAGVKVPTLVLHRANTAHNLDKARRSSEKPAVQRSKYSIVSRRGRGLFVIHVPDTVPVRGRRAGLEVLDALEEGQRWSVVRGDLQSGP